jgi:hypothetical protein
MVEPRSKEFPAAAGYATMILPGMYSLLRALQLPILTRLLRYLREGGIRKLKITALTKIIANSVQWLVGSETLSPNPGSGKVFSSCIQIRIFRTIFSVARGPRKRLSICSGS